MVNELSTFPTAQWSRGKILALGTSVRMQGIPGSTPGWALFALGSQHLSYGFVFPSILGISRIFWGIYLPRFEVEGRREEVQPQLWVHRRPRSLSRARAYQLRRSVGSYICLSGYFSLNNYSVCVWPVLIPNRVKSRCGGGMQPHTAGHETGLLFASRRV